MQYIGLYIILAGVMVCMWRFTMGDASKRCPCGARSDEGHSEDCPWKDD